MTNEELDKKSIEHQIKSLYHWIETEHIFGSLAIDIKRVLDNDADNDVTKEQKLKLCSEMLNKNRSDTKLYFVG